MQGLLLLLPLTTLLFRSSDWEEIPLDSPEWRTTAATCEQTEHLGRPALRLQGGKRWLTAVDFRSGVIEVDLAFGSERGFGGLAWHLQDAENHEYFYVRPHQSGKPDACQYTPVDHGLSAWQLFHGPGYGAPVDYRFHQWTRVRIVVAGTRAEVFVDSDEPTLRIRELHRGGAPAGSARGSTGIGLVASNFAPVYVSRLRIRREEPPPVSRPTGVAPEAPAGTIRRFEVSRPFGEELLTGRTHLDGLAAAELEGSWTSLDSGPSGVANLARVQGIAPGADTVFARVRLASERERVAALRFGYSDRVRIFLNGRLLYSGDNGYRTRDYRYLGTIGLFDAVPLELDSGENELLFAVSESFGGWGVLAMLPDRTGIRVLE